MAAEKMPEKRGNQCIKINATDDSISKKELAVGLKKERVSSAKEKRSPSTRNQQQQQSERQESSLDFHFDSFPNLCGAGSSEFSNLDESETLRLAAHNSLCTRKTNSNRTSSFFQKNPKPGSEAAKQSPTLYSLSTNEKDTEISEEVGTDLGVLPPWAAVHVGSHDLSVCQRVRQKTNDSASSANAANTKAAHSSRYESLLGGQSCAVIPRRRTFSIFREWLEEDHRRSRKASGPRGQYPARRGKSQSATTRGFERLEAVEQRCNAEKKARRAVEAEVRELSVNQTPQQQQEAYLKAQQQAVFTQSQQQDFVDETAAREEARIAAAEAAAAAASAVIAQAHWPSRHKLLLHQPHKLQQVQKNAPSSAAPMSSSDTRQGLLIRGPHTKSESKSSKEKRLVQPKLSVEHPQLLGSLGLRVCQAILPRAAEGDVGVSQRSRVRSEVPPSSSSTSHTRALRHRQLPEQLSFFGRPRWSASVVIPEQGTPSGDVEPTSPVSCEEEDIQSFNPLEEVLLFLQKAKRADGYFFGLTQCKRGQRASSCWSKQSKSTQALGSTENTRLSKLLDIDKTSESVRILGKRQQHRGKEAVQQASGSLNFLPLEAFDLPDDYGEPSPRVLLQRCRSECQLRRLKSKAQELRAFENYRKNPLEERSSASPIEWVSRHQIHAGVTENAQGRTKIKSFQSSCQEDTAQEELPATDEASTIPRVSKNAAELPEAVELLGQTCVEGEAEAEVLHFVGSSWSSIPCTVLRYDAEQRRFEVQLRDGTLKAVRRLALRFCFEEPQMQQKRLEACNSRRRQMLLRHQFLQSVNDLPSAAFPPLPQNSINSIVKAAVGVGRLRRQTFVMESVRPALEGLKKSFLEAAKLSAVLHCAEGLRAKGKLSSALQFLYPQHQNQQTQNQDLQGMDTEGSSPLLQLLQPLLSSSLPATGRPNFGTSSAFCAAQVALRKKQIFVNPKTFRVGDQNVTSIGRRKIPFCH